MKRMDADTHEAVWGLGARAARESRGKFDLDGAFLAAVRKHGTKVFPASVAREDDAWFEEYFQAFRDGAKSAGMKESMTTMRGLIRHLEESNRGTKSALTRLDREAEKSGQTERFAANALLDSIALIIKRAKADGYSKIRFQERDVQKRYDEGWKHTRDALSALKNADKEEDMGMEADDAMRSLSKADHAFGKVALSARIDPVAASNLNLIRGIIDEIRSAREMWRLSQGI